MDHVGHKWGLEHCTGPVRHNNDDDVISPRAEGKQCPFPVALQCCSRQQLCLCFPFNPWPGGTCMEVCHITLQIFTFIQLNNSSAHQLHLVLKLKMLELNRASENLTALFSISQNEFSSQLGWMNETAQTRCKAFDRMNETKMNHYWIDWWPQIIAQVIFTQTFYNNKSVWIGHDQVQ